jgi:phosphoribosyl 1,2-cyclic phosphodiesterase
MFAAASHQSTKAFDTTPLQRSEASCVPTKLGKRWVSFLSPAAPFEPSAIVITHSHPDHAFGLKDGAPCPVYATPEAWKAMKSFAIPEQFRNVLEPRRPKQIAGLIFEPFPVIHSVLAPAVGYRISAGKVELFYVPDVAAIPDRSRALAGIGTYIGDGATITRSLIRRERRYGRLIGHASIETQLGWCRAEGVSEMIVTHCGSAIVRSPEEHVERMLESLGKEYGIRTEVAHDGMEIVLRRLEPGRSSHSKLPGDYYVN